MANNSEYQKKYRLKNKKVLLEKKALYYKKNKEKIKKYNKENRYRFVNRDKDFQLKYKYGISLEFYKKMVSEQKDLCLICKEKKPLVVDHCHISGIVRGLLCAKCNKGLGYFQDKKILLKNAIKYLEITDEKMEKIIEGVKTKLSN